MAGCGQIDDGQIKLLMVVVVRVVNAREKHQSADEAVKLKRGDYILEGEYLEEGWDSLLLHLACLKTRKLKRNSSYQVEKADWRENTSLRI